MEQWQPVCFKALVEEENRTMTMNLEGEVQTVLETMGDEQEPEIGIPESQISEDTQDIYVFIVRKGIEEPEDSQIIESLAQTKTTQRFEYSTLCTVLLCSLPMFLSIAVQVFVLFNPPIAAVLLIPRSQTVTLSGTLQLGWVIAPMTLSQSTTTLTTGRGHQAQRSAQGTVTFYNGELNNVTIAAGTLFSSSRGVQIATDQDGVIPAADPTANPPVFGRVTVSAHAINPGASGNIPAYDINQACCFASVIAKNTTPFTGGQDERNFQTVAKSDLDTTATTLRTTLSVSMQGALQGQLKPQEQLYILPCAPTVTSDHLIGQEATNVKVTVSETCSAVAYNNDVLVTKATDLLSHRARQHLGTGYSLFGQARVTITEATVTRTTTTLIFSCQGLWVYALSQEAQQHIKHLIAGEPRQEAIKLLLSLPGIERASIVWDEHTKLPKNVDNIHFVILV